jgi:hypothetical protein
VDGRDKPGHDDSGFLLQKFKKTKKSQKLLINRHNFRFLRIFIPSETRLRRCEQKTASHNVPIYQHNFKTF